MTELNRQKQLQRLRILTGRDDADELFEQLLTDAETTALAYMHRKALPEALVTSVGDAALVAYNRLGTEGESGRSEGGESYSFIELPDRFYKQWKSYRLARVGGYAHEAEQDTDTES